MAVINTIPILGGIGDHASTHQNGGDDEIDATGLAGRINYVDRGDPSENDFNVGDLTADGSFHDLDLSSIIDAGSKLVLLRVFLQDDAVQMSLIVRKNGNSNDRATNRIRTQVSNVGIQGIFLVSPDSSGLIEYRLSNTSFTTITINVLGWFV